MEKNIVQKLGDNVFGRMPRFINDDDSSYICIYDNIVIDIVYDPNDSYDDVPEDFDDDDPIKSTALWRIIIYTKDTKELLSSGETINNTDLLQNNYQAVYEAIDRALTDASTKTDAFDKEECMKYVKAKDNEVLDTYLASRQ